MISKEASLVTVLISVNLSAMFFELIWPDSSGFCSGARKSVGILTDPKIIFLKNLCVSFVHYFNMLQT